MFQKFLIGAGVLAALISVLIFSGKVDVGQTKQTVIEGEAIMWGTVPTESIQTLMQSFNAQAKTYRFSYVYVPEDQLRNKLVSALANNSGPDMIFAPQGFIIEHASYLYPFPTSYMPEKTYKDAYVDGATLFWTGSGALALPVSAEPLVLFYNRTILSKKGIVNPPYYWDELTTQVTALTTKDQYGNIVESGLAMGTPSNAPYQKDIAMAIVTQLGQTPVLPILVGTNVMYSVLMNSPVQEGSSVKPLESAVRFMTQFADPTRSTYAWSSYMTNAQDAFVAEKLAMYIGYASDESVIRKRNPRVDFSLSVLPQTRGYNTFATGLRMYGIATLRQSKNPSVALTVEQALGGGLWGPQLALALGSYPALRATYATQQVGEVIRRSVLVARSWYDISPAQTSTYFTTMMQDIVAGRNDVSTAIGLFLRRLQAMYNPV